MQRANDRREGSLVCADYARAGNGAGKGVGARAPYSSRHFGNQRGAYQSRRAPLARRQSGLADVAHHRDDGGQQVDALTRGLSGIVYFVRVKGCLDKALMAARLGVREMRSRNKLLSYLTVIFRTFAVPPEFSSGNRNREDTGDTPSKRNRPMQSSTRIVPFAGLALVAFVASILILVLMIGNAQLLVGLGLAGNLYYIALVPLGLSVAAFLFGVLRSYAVYKGNVGGGNLELGGPVVGFLLVVILGFKLVPDPSHFAVTVFVHGEGGKQELVLRNRGAVLLDLGADRRRETIGDRGQAYFPGIPPIFRGQEVRVLIDAEGYELSDPNVKTKLETESLYVPVRRKVAILEGYVRTTEGSPVAGATVSFSGRTTTTDSAGFFRLSIASPAANENASLNVVASGYVPWHGPVTLGANEIAIQLSRSQ